MISAGGKHSTRGSCGRAGKGLARAAGPALAAIAAVGLCLAAPAAASAAQQPAGTALQWGLICNGLNSEDPGVNVPTPGPVGLPKGTRVTAVAAGESYSLALATSC